MNKKKAQKKIQKLAKAGKVTYAEQDRVDALPTTLIDEFLDKVFDIQSAWISNESQLSDFLTYEPDDREVARRRLEERIFELYGIKCKAGDYVVDVLETIRERNT